MGTCIDGQERGGDTWKDMEYEQEKKQRKADASRAETLYVSPEYKVFLLTRQRGGCNDGRDAYVSVKPFCSLSDAAVAQLTAKAIPWDANNSQIYISLREPALFFYDAVTKTESQVFIADLDADVRAKLRFNQATESAWEKYADVSPVAVAGNIAVGKPLTFRKPMNAL